VNDYLSAALPGGGSPRGSPPVVTRWIVWSWLDSTPDVSCTNSTQDYMDVDDQATDLAVGVWNPLPRRLLWAGEVGEAPGRNSRSASFCQLQGRPVGGRGLLQATQLAEQVGLDPRQVVIARQPPVALQLLDLG
jgi:hypothetical protein